MITVRSANLGTQWLFPHKLSISEMSHVSERNGAWSNPAPWPNWVDGSPSRKSDYGDYLRANLRWQHRIFRRPFLEAV